MLLDQVATCQPPLVDQTQMASVETGPSSNPEMAGSSPSPQRATN
jgi:hypothetical protein